MSTHSYSIGGEEAIRVRTITRKPLGKIWKADGIQAIRATSRYPNVTNRSQQDLRADEASRLVDIGGDGATVPDIEVEEMDKKLRDFKITKHVLGKFGYTLSCPGCEGSLAGKRRVHTSGCRRRLEDEICRDEKEKVRIKERDMKLGKTN